MNADKTRAWNDYWDEPRLAACLRNEEGNYGGEIATQWNRFFRGLENQASILDLATGNGAIALLALDCSDRLGRSFQIDAVDAAAINPVETLPELASRLARIHFHCGVRCENLPFEAASFDAVVGQYALEYADVCEAMAEVARVLKPGGRVMFITHSQDSEVFENTLIQLAALEKLSALDLVGRVETLIRLEAGGRSPEFDRTLEDFRRNAAAAMHLLDTCSGSNKTFISRFLQSLAEHYQQRRGCSLKRNLGKLEQLQNDLDSHEVRLGALRNAALNGPAIRSLQDLLAQSGFVDIESVPLDNPSSGTRLGHKFIGVLHRQS
jgi:ubiquinone/menaquinone biosynthesis C-methylase UbiE